MSDEQYLRSVKDDEMCRRLFALRDTLLECNGHVRFEEAYLRGRALTAVPFEDAQHFSRDTATALQEACGRCRFATGYVIPLFDARQCCYQITFSAKAFLALSDIDVIWLEFLIVEESQGFSLLSTTLFNTLAGPRAFAESVLGMTVEEGWELFLREFVHEAHFRESEKQQFISLVHRYQQAAN